MVALAAIPVLHALSLSYYAHALQEEAIRNRVVGHLARLRSVSCLGGDESQWLLRTAGWSQNDIEFYEMHFAVPTGGGLFLWAGQIPTNWGEFLTAKQAAETSGRTMASVALARNGLDGYADAVGCERMFDPRWKSVLRSRWCDRAESEFAPVAVLMWSGEFERSLEVLRATGTASRQHRPWVASGPAPDSSSENLQVLTRQRRHWAPLGGGREGP
jgi:hypothetical protein